MFLIIIHPPSFWLGVVVGAIFAGPIALYLLAAFAAWQRIGEPAQLRTTRGAVEPRFIKAGEDKLGGGTSPAPPLTLPRDSMPPGSSSQTSPPTSSQPSSRSRRASPPWR